jgi:antitoxin (DNA-binding transcriptional repressor) of toxin-antitoxin stability system
VKAGWKLFRSEPVATMAVVTAVLGVLTLVGVSKTATGPIGILIGAILAFPVRSGVTPNATVVQVAKTAAQAAATTVAGTIDTASAGVAGTITEAGAAIADIATTDVVNSVLKDAGFSRKDRAAATATP